MSVWQIPVATRRTNTSSKRGSSSDNVSTVNGVFFARATAAVICIASTIDECCTKGRYYMTAMRITKETLMPVSFRRLVTGRDADGKSRLLEDTQVQEGRLGNFNFWRTEKDPAAEDD